jgi:hypothetical protein
MQEEAGAVAPSPAFRAIVIGTDSYPSMEPLAQLRGCVNDAISIRDFLIERALVPPGNIELLTSPEREGGKLSTAANIRAALSALCAEGAVRAGDHVVLFYACHGVRLSKKGGDPASPMFYGLAAADLSRGEQGFANLILDRELNRFLRTLTRRGVAVSVIADTCNSGASTRDLEGPVRERSLGDADDLFGDAWPAYLQNHPGIAPRAAQAETRDIAAASAEQSAARPGRDADFVILAACQDIEKAKETFETVVSPEGQEVRQPHGVLTLSLLQALRKVPAAQITSLRWMDLYDDLQRAVMARVAAMRAGPQRPALEGRPERTVFGGKWTAFPPGFTVRKVNDAYSVDGGILHGLDVGAELLLYPADTVDFEAASRSAARAMITTATLATSTAQLLDAAATVQDKSRARLVKPSPGTKPMSVRLCELPEAVRKAADFDDKDVRAHIALVTAAEPAHVEVRPYSGELPDALFSLSPRMQESWLGARDGFILVRSDLGGAASHLPAFSPPPKTSSRICRARGRL